MDELPARKEEVHHAQEEGIEFLVLNNPVKIVGDENGHVNDINVLSAKSHCRTSSVHSNVTATYYSYIS